MTYSVFKANEDAIDGIMTFPPDAPSMPPNWGLYITVDDADETAEKAVGKGAKIVVPPKDIPDVGRFCVLHGVTPISIISYSSKI